VGLTRRSQLVDNLGNNCDVFKVMQYSYRINYEWSANVILSSGHRSKMILCLERFPVCTALHTRL
jgi:hypothetical protein